jgi:hypothetical protein
MLFITFRQRQHENGKQIGRAGRHATTVPDAGPANPLGGQAGARVDRMMPLSLIRALVGVCVEKRSFHTKRYAKRAARSASGHCVLLE